MYSIQTICSVVEGKFLLQDDGEIEHLCYDTRRIQEPATSLFFALRTEHNDGHKYISDAVKKGLRHFIVSEENNSYSKVKGSVILVPDTLTALQQLVAYHRQQFNYPVIGITGSNGKTVVKEWLFQLLHDDYKIVRSPRSFNSQIGVPLSVWEMNEQHNLAIFEAGISRPREMEKLQRIIQPTIGILTNIGEAHGEGFLDPDQKLEEKLQLFKDCPVLIARGKDLGGRSGLVSKQTKLLTWGHAATNEFVLRSTNREEEFTRITIFFAEKEYSVRIRFADPASIENAITCFCVLLMLGYQEESIHERMSRLHAIDMRLQLNHSINECLVINDSYSTDVTSLKIALDFLRQQSSGLKRTVILSEFFESGKTDAALYSEIAALLHDYEIGKAIVIGERIGFSLPQKLPASIEVQTCLSTEDFIASFRSSQFYQEIILIKGARRFEFERIAQLFAKKLHQTVLEINLNALAHNLKEYQKKLQHQTKIMAMVKAFSYGSGGAEIASILQYHHVHYLGVAYADEGVELVKSGIQLPVMVMNAEESSFQSIVDEHLEPVLYSFELLEKFQNYIQSQGLSSYPVHLEIETGMNRLGFSLSELDKLKDYFAGPSLFVVQSVFTHLAASEDPAQDAFTRQQAELFYQAINKIEKFISYPFLKHLANSAAIIRHPDLQMDMVRLGIGLYGIESDQLNQLSLQAVATLRSTVAQLKKIRKGESVSYNRRGVVHRDSLIATVRIGYADGYSRLFSNGVGKMMIRNQLAPVIGTVCMDMTMIDVTDIEGIMEGDEVIVFGPSLAVQELARWIGTIPYEIMTGVSQRVKRIYFHE
ncbi:MAG: bifunctional UDP-N-acetylmuramoyl-tripeptide:D-alanyl-D-alanine ligase/alanine racemase [Flavisolibacter sp.]